MSFFYF